MPQESHRAPFKLSFHSATVVEFPRPAHARAFLLPQVPIKPRIHAEVGRYRLRLAESAADREAACRLRFKVFNIEMREGLESSYQTGLDIDRFDTVCDHLLVEDKHDRRIVGTYRMQSGSAAAANLGYYSEQEFNLAAYEPLRAEILELGRASIDREHRTPEVLTLLWRGIAQYAANMGLRYLLGCSSINSQDPAEGWQMYRQFERYRVPSELETLPTAAYACPAASPENLTETGDTSELGDPARQAGLQTEVPKLLKTYLAIGCRIGGPPAWDRDFGTIDFLTFLDLKQVTSSVRNRFLGAAFAMSIRTIRRALSLAFVLALCIPRLWLLRLRGPLTLQRRALWGQATGRQMMAAMGIRYRVTGKLPQRGLLVSNHLSYLDILIYGSIVPCFFVSKAEISRWPFFGWMSKAGGTIYVHRSGHTRVDGVLQQIASRLNLPVMVLLFPEGTSTDGSRLLNFRSRLFAPAVDAEAPVTAASIRYAAADGTPEREFCWFGDDEFLPHLLKTLAVPGLPRKSTSASQSSTTIVAKPQPLHRQRSRQCVLKMKMPQIVRMRVGNP